MTCQVCGTDELVYDIDRHHRGTARFCIRCLAIKRGQHTTTEDASRHDEELLEGMVEAAYSWFTVLARIDDDNPPVKERKEYSIDENTEEFLWNVMGDDAYLKPSDIRGGKDE